MPTLSTAVLVPMLSICAQYLLAPIPYKPVKLSSLPKVCRLQMDYYAAFTSFGWV